MAASRLEKCGTAVDIVDGKAYQLDSCNGEVTPRVVFRPGGDRHPGSLHLHYGVQFSCSEDS